MRTRTIGSIVLAGLMTLGATTTAAASPAVAGPTPQVGGQVCKTVYNDSGTLVGRGCFFAWGDNFTADDYIADGLRVVTHWQTDYGRRGQCHNARGALTPVVCDDVNLAEHRKVRIRVSVRDGANGRDEATSSWSHWFAIGDPLSGR